MSEEVWIMMTWDSILGLSQVNSTFNLWMSYVENPKIQYVLDVAPRKFHGHIPLDCFVV